MTISGKHISDNRELFVFLPWEEMSVSHGHGDILVTHELLQLHECDPAGLRQPGCEGMPHGVQGHGVQAVAVFRGQIELSDSGLEAGGRFIKSCPLARLLKNGFRWLAFVRLEHLDQIFRHTDENPFASFLDDIKAAGVSIHVLSAQLENFRGAEAGSQGEQSHVMQLRMPLFKVVQKGLGLFPCQKAQSFIVGFDHFPCTTLGGQRVDTAPHTCGDGTVYGGSHERKDIVYSLTGQSFPLPYPGVGLSCGLFGLCIPGKRLQELCLETGEQIRGQLGNWQGVNFALEVGVVLTVVLINILPFASAPFKVGMHQVPDGDFIPLNGIDTRGLKLGEELCPFLSGRSRTNTLTVPAHGFPVALALVVGVPETVDFVVLSGSRIALGGLPEEDALELGLRVFSFSFATHMSSLENTSQEGKILIQNLSKMNFQDKGFYYNYLNLIIIYLLLLVICDRERERHGKSPYRYVAGVLFKRFFLSIT